VVRYNDTNKVRRILLSATENRPEDGVVHFSQPLGRAVLGADVDDEIQFPHREGRRSQSLRELNVGRTNASGQDSWEKLRTKPVKRAAVFPPVGRRQPGRRGRLQVVGSARLHSPPDVAGG
jgi:hypothetical protein